MARVKQDPRETARRFAAEVVAPRASLRDAHPEHELDQVIAKSASFGLLRATMPTSWGGLGCGLRDVAAIVHEIAAVCAGHALLLAVNYMALDLAVRLWSHTTASQLLRSVEAEETATVWGIVLPESFGQNLWPHPVITATRRAGCYVLQGSARFAFSSPTAKFLTLFASDAATDDQWLALVVPTAAAGVSLGRPSPLLGLRACSVGPAEFHDVEVDEQLVLMGPSDGHTTMREVLGRYHGVLSFVSLGLCEYCLERARRMLNVRLQSAEDLGTSGYSNIQFSRILARIEALRSVAARAVDSAELDGNDSHRVGICARMFGNETTEIVASELVRFMGRQGYTRDSGLEKAIRDIKTLSLFPVTTPQLSLLLLDGQDESRMKVPRW